MFENFFGFGGLNHVTIKLTRSSLGVANPVNGLRTTPVRCRRALRSQGGFTLIELRGHHHPWPSSRAGGAGAIRARGPVQAKAAARAPIELFGAALGQYWLDTGNYPPTAAGLDARVKCPNVANWNGPYLKKASVSKGPLGKYLALQERPWGPR